MGKKKDTVERVLEIDAELDRAAEKLAKEKKCSAEEIYRNIIHLFLGAVHTMEYNGLSQGYEEMSDINLELSAL